MEKLILLLDVSKKISISGKNVTQIVNKNIQRVSVFEIHANSICSYKPPVSSDQIFDGNTRWMRRINVTLRGDIPVSDVTSLTGTTPKTRRIYTRSARRELICIRVTPVEQRRGLSHESGATLVISDRYKRIRYGRVVKGTREGRTWRVLYRERGAGTLSLRVRNYDPVRFALSAGRDCITMRGIPGIAFTCLELLREPQ